MTDTWHAHRNPYSLVVVIEKHADGKRVALSARLVKGATERCLIAVASLRLFGTRYGLVLMRFPKDVGSPSRRYGRVVISNFTNAAVAS